jgi:L-rhamnose mutarotase
MHENHWILDNSKLSLLFQCNSENFPVYLSKPTRILYVIEWYTVEAYITYINNYVKDF